MTEVREKPNEWRRATPKLTPATRLLLLLARVELDQDQSIRVAELCAQVQEWDAFAAKAAEYFIAPLCLHHLGSLATEDVPKQARSALARQTLPLTLRTLRHAALQREFIEHHVRPLNIPFAVIKGRALAARYYPDISLRFARDLDVLVPARRIPELVIAAQKDGYRVYPERRLLSVDEAHILSRQSRVVTLVGSAGIPIEVHAQLDKAGFLLDHCAMLNRAETVDIDGVPTGILTTTDHFVYICLHHTKHFWSRLNWLADLDALIKAPDFDRDAVMVLARERGIEKTVAACLAFHQAYGAENPWEQAIGNLEALDLLRACLLILEEGSQKEFEMRPDRLSVDFNFEWQFPEGFRRRRRLRACTAALSPSIADYQAMPLPRFWHWLYFATRPLRLLFRIRSKTVGRE